jgi:hypothetical protein
LAFASFIFRDCLPANIELLGNVILPKSPLFPQLFETIPEYLALLIHTYVKYELRLENAQENALNMLQTGAFCAISDNLSKIVNYAIIKRAASSSDLRQCGFRHKVRE